MSSKAAQNADGQFIWRLQVRPLEQQEWNPDQGKLETVMAAFAYDDREKLWHRTPCGRSLGDYPVLKRVLSSEPSTAYAEIKDIDFLSVLLRSDGLIISEQALIGIMFNCRDSAQSHPFSDLPKKIMDAAIEGNDDCTVLSVTKKSVESEESTCE